MTNTYKPHKYTKKVVELAPDEIAVDYILAVRKHKNGTIDKYYYCNRLDRAVRIYPGDSKT